MAIIKGTLAKRINGKVKYVYPKTTADIVEYSPNLSVKDKIDSLELGGASIDNIDANNVIYSSTKSVRNKIEDIELNMSNIVNSISNINATNILYDENNSIKSKIDNINSKITNILELLDNNQPSSISSAHYITISNEEIDLNDLNANDINNPGSNIINYNLVNVIASNLPNGITNPVNCIVKVSRQVNDNNSIYINQNLIYNGNMYIRTDNGSSIFNEWKKFLTNIELELIQQQIKSVFVPESISGSPIINFNMLGNISSSSIFGEVTTNFNPVGASSVIGNYEIMEDD